jgi:outer membrane protein assembly factor BamB
MNSRLPAVALLVLSAAALEAEDWPQWLGPRGDSTWNDAGLITRFPAGGPKIVWRVPVANGYSGPSVSGGKVFVMDYQIASGTVDAKGGRTSLTGKERVVCFDEKSGRQLWAHAYDCPIALSFPNGPRCSPVIDDGMVYSLGAEGHLSAVNAADGTVVWEKELKKEYKCDSPIWGFSATPLVRGILLYTLAGGAGSAVVALNKKTGSEVWRSLTTEDVGYAPPVMTTRDGKDELIAWHSEALNGLDPLTGALRWSQPFKTFMGMSIMTPRVTPDGILIGVMNAKSMLVKPGDGKVEIVWEGTPKIGPVPTSSTPVVFGEYVYSCDADGDLRCFRSATGERVWSTLEVTGNKKIHAGTYFMVRTPQQWVLFNDFGELILADLSPSGYKESARAKVLDPLTPATGRKVVWSHPAFANRCVFARNDKELVCVSLAEE